MKTRISIRAGGIQPHGRRTFPLDPFHPHFQPMLRMLFRCCLLLCVSPLAAAAQTVVIPSDKAPYRQRFELHAQEAQYLLLPQTPLPPVTGPFTFRWEHPDLTSMLEDGPAISYLSTREGGFLLQVLHARPRRITAEMLGPQRFRIQDAEGETVAHGAMLVVSRPPEAGDLRNEEATRLFETHRASEVRLEVRTHGNLAGRPVLVNTRDWELIDLRELEPDTAGVVTLAGTLRPLRPEATELRLAVETRDGRSTELVYPGITVRPPAPRRIRIGGGPVFLDAAGRGTTRLVIRDLPGLGTPEVTGDAAGEVAVIEQRYDDTENVLDALVEFVARTPRAPGTREVREVLVRSGLQTYRGLVEIVGLPVVAAVRTESGRAALPIGAEPALLRITGQNLDGLRLDCSPLGAESRCRTVHSAATELVAEVALGGGVREGEHLLPLVGAEARAHHASPQAMVRLVAEFPAIPMPMVAADFLRLGCGAGCRLGADGESVIVRPGAAGRMRLQFDDGALPAAHGWQKLLVTITRVRGEQRQVVRNFGTPAAPRMLRSGLPAGDLAILDAGIEPRHGDVFVVRVEHAAEQYAPEHRAGVATAEAFVRRIYVDGGAAKRFTGDIAVQPVLLTMRDGSVDPLFPNAGFGVTWQFLDERMEPRLYSAKLQLLATNIQPGGGSASPAGQPAVFLSGNLRIPGTDPARPLSLTSGLARMFGEEPGWRVLLGGGIDLGVARLIFGG